MKYGKQIGKGMFTTAYLNDKGTVTLVTSDPLKECLAEWGFGGSELFPKMERVDYYYNHNDEIINIIEMEYFPKVSSLKNALNKEDYQLYLTLRKISESTPYFDRGYKYTDWLREEFSKLDRGEELVEAVKACMNYTEHVGFEISPRNVAVKNGKLILLDVFFCGETLRRIRKSR